MNIVTFLISYITVLQGNNPSFVGMTGRTGMIKGTYIGAVILMAAWAVGFLVFHAGNQIHLLLALAMTAILINIIREG